jgi:hypothetical protein
VHISITRQKGYEEQVLKNFVHKEYINIPDFSDSYYKNNIKIEVAKITNNDALKQNRFTLPHFDKGEDGKTFLVHFDEIIIRSPAFEMFINIVLRDKISYLNTDKTTTKEFIGELYIQYSDYYQNIENFKRVIKISGKYKILSDNFAFFTRLDGKETFFIPLKQGLIESILNKQGISNEKLLLNQTINKLKATIGKPVNIYEMIIYDINNQKPTNIISEPISIKL